MRYDAVSSNDNSITDGNARQDAYVVAQPYVVTDDYGTFRVERTDDRGELELFDGELAMGIIGDKHIGAREEVVADGDAVDCCYMGSIAYDTMVPDRDVRMKILLLVFCPGCQLNSRT